MAMEIKGNGVNVSVNPAEQSDTWLIDAVSEIAEVVKERGLEIPEFAGSVAIEGASVTETKVDPTEAKEALTGQLYTALKGYLSQVNHINKNRLKADKIEAADFETLSTEFEDWFTEDRQTYITRAMEADPELTFTLCAVMNEIVTPDEIKEDARVFGKRQPYETTIYREVINQYTPEKFSGTNPENGKKFKFVAVPSKIATKLNGTVYAQQQALAELQIDAPFLEAPTPLVGMTFLHTRRAMGDKLVGYGTANATYMRSYGMEEKPLDRSRFVPYLIVLDGGRLIMRDSDVRSVCDGFALVG